MRGCLYYVAIILVIGWLLGVFYFHDTTGLIHILLVLAVVSLLLQIIRGK